MTRQQEIKIVSINTWKCDGDYRTRMRILVKQLTELKPHIVACQECFFSQDADTLKYLAESLKMNSIYLPGRRKNRLFELKITDSESGLGVLSVYPIRSINNFNLPVVAEDNDRQVQQVEITLPLGVEILVTNTHLTHLRQPGGLRRAQAEALAGFVSSNKTGSYHLICGDFNASIDSLELKTFRCLSGAVDCYEAGKGPEPRYSLLDPLKIGHKICVDHIFSQPSPGKKSYPKFIKSNIVLDLPDAETGLYASDHFGICTTLVIHE